MPVFGTTIRFESGARSEGREGFGERGSFFDRFFQPRWPDPIRLPVGLRAPVIRPTVSVSAPTVVPAVVPQPVAQAPVVVDSTDTGLEPVDFSEGVIDPDLRPRYTVSEIEEPGTFFPESPNVWQDTPPTDWDQYYRDYVELNEPEGTDMPIDWGDVISTVATGLFTPGAAVQAASTAFTSPFAAGPPVINPTVTTTAPGRVPMVTGATCPPNQPRYAKICLATGQVMPLRRRRRRRLLTSSDLADLASLKAIVGGGAAMNSAVVKAVRR